MSKKWSNHNAYSLFIYYLPPSIYSPSHYDLLFSSARNRCRIEPTKKGLVSREAKELTCFSWSDNENGRYALAGSEGGKIIVFPRGGGPSLQEFDLTEKSGIFSMKLGEAGVLWCGCGNASVMKVEFNFVVDDLKELREKSDQAPPPPPSIAFRVTNIIHLPSSIESPLPAPHLPENLRMSVEPHPLERKWQHVRHLTLTNDKQGLIAGKEGGSLFYRKSLGDKTGKVHIISGGHASECTQVASYPLKHDTIAFASTGKDSLVCFWGSESNIPTHRFRIGHNGCGIAFSRDGNLLALGCSDGYTKIFGMHSVDGTTLPTFLKEHKTFRSAVDCVKFSPTNKFLAAGSHDNYVDLFDCLQRDFPRVRRLKGPTSYLTHLDFSIDGQLLMTNDGAGEILHFHVETGKGVKSREEAASFTLLTDEKTQIDLNDHKCWADWSCVLGFPVMGIWPDVSIARSLSARMAMFDSCKKIQKKCQEYSFR